MSRQGRESRGMKGMCKCPFCGSENIEARWEVQHGSPREHWIQCEDCYARGPLKAPKGDIYDNSRLVAPGLLNMRSH